jgi:organic radical activating enzyme
MRSDKSLSASNELIDNFLEILPQIPAGARIRLIGGEPTIHPRFFEVAKSILRNGHFLSVQTNFSCPNTCFEKLLDEIDSNDEGKNKLSIAASLHLSQVKSIERFVDKVLAIKKYGGNKLRINVLSCLTEENFEALKNIREKFVLKKVNFTLQRLMAKKQRVVYSQEIEQWLKSISITNSQKIACETIKLNKNTYGLECSAGYSFIKIYVDGSVKRCFESHKNIFNLGSLKDGQIKTFVKPLPCLTHRCICALPLNFGLVAPNNKRDIPLADKIKNL